MFYYDMFYYDMLWFDGFGLKVHWIQKKQRTDKMIETTI